MKVWVRGSDDDDDDDEVDWRARADSSRLTAAARDSNSCQVKTSSLYHFKLLKHLLSIFESDIFIIQWEEALFDSLCSVG